MNNYITNEVAQHKYSNNKYYISNFIYYIKIWVNAKLTSSTCTCRMCKITLIRWSLDSVFNACVVCLCLLVGPVHCLRDLQTSFFNKIFIKNLPALFTYLKIILLQCFQFLIFNNK